MLVKELAKKAKKDEMRDAKFYAISRIQDAQRKVKSAKRIFKQLESDYKDLLNRDVLELYRSRR